MEPDQVAVRFWLDPIPPEDMPALAARLLAGGHDTPALRRAAGLARDDDPRDIRQEFGRALAELGAWLPDRSAAELAAAISLARQVLSGALPMAECAARVRDIWEFDDIIYPVLPGDNIPLSLMFLELSGYYVSAARLHVTAADRSGAA